MGMGRIIGCGVGLAAALSACGAPGQAGPAGGQPLSTDVSGSAQKGPFSSGSKVTVAELDANLVQTGRSFSTTMSGDGGGYSVRGVQLGTPYARVEVSGFYFDEVRGELSASPLSIFGYVDLSNPGASNINLLGHLEATRLEHLVSSSGLSFAAAKSQAHRELLELFELDPAAVGSAEGLDISQAGEGNAALLAISIMLQGTRTVAELSELLAKIQDDLRQDGTLDDPENGAALLEGAKMVDLERARENLNRRFSEAGVDASVPAIDTQIDRFTETAPYVYEGGRIRYPIVDYANVLDPGLTRFTFDPARPGLRFVVDLPEAMGLEVRITNHSSVTRDLSTTNIWSFLANHPPVGWTVTPYDFDTGVQVFRATQAGRIEIEGFAFDGAGTATVEYFEDGASAPSRVKEIEWSGWNAPYNPLPPLSGAGGAGSADGGFGGAGPRPGEQPPGTGGAGNGGAGGHGGTSGDGSGGSSGYGGAPQPPDPKELCGNGAVDAGEDCDGADLNGASCASLMPGTIGELRCEPNVCRFDQSSCEFACGNGVLDAGETCDIALWEPQACQACNPECQVEARPCPDK